jgi:hypothetical protein
MSNKEPQNFEGGEREWGVFLTEVCHSNFILAANTSSSAIQFRPPPKE